MCDIAALKDEQNSCLFNTRRLRLSNVLLIGVGGIGCGIAVHLAGAGVGSISVCDFDVAAAENLNRQFIFTTADLGARKAEAAARFVSGYAPDCRVTPIVQKVSGQNAADIISGYDLVMLACDNIPTRLAVNEACSMLCINLIDSGISGGCGSSYLYIPGKSACLACLMDSTAESADKRTVGAVAGIVAGIASVTALEILSSKSHKKAGKLILTDALNNTTDELNIKKLKGCRICGGDLNVG